MPDHIGRMHAFGRVAVMGATCGVDMMIPRPPAGSRRADQPPALKRQFLRRVIDRHFARLGNRFGSARKLDPVRPVPEFHFLAIRAINLRMKSEVRSEPFSLRWSDPPCLIAKDKRGNRRRALLVP